VEVSGGRDRLLEVEMDARRVEALGLSPFQVRQLIQELEYIREAGMVETGGALRTVAIRQRAESVDDLLQLPLLTDHGRIVRLRDVARVHDTYEDVREHYRIDGFPAVSFTVHKEAGTNVVRVADAVKARIADLEPVHPAGVRLILDQDESDAVRTQLSDLRNRALIAAVVIFLVLLLFLQSLRAAAIVFTTIAFSVLITLNLIYWGGFTLNVLTLMGIAMGFGLMVDNAIVVLENTYRRRKLGDAPELAAERGAGDVVLPILAATLTTVVVLIPFVYLQGELQAYYVPLAIVVGFSLLASLFVAFSFIPGLASRVLGGVRPDNVSRALPDLARAYAEDRVARTGAAGMPWYIRLYATLVGTTVRRPVLTVLVVLLVLGYSWRQFDEHVTRGVRWGNWWGQQNYIDIQVRMPRGEDMERVDALTRYFEDRLRAMPEVERFVTRVTPTFSRTEVTFPDSLEATGIPEAIKEQLLAYSYQFGGVDVRVFGYGPSFYGGGSTPPNYSIQVYGYNYDKVRAIAEDLGRRLEQFSRIREVDTNSSGRWVRERETELVLDLDRQALALHGLTARDVVWQVAAATRSSAYNADVRIGGEELQFSVKLAGNRDLDLLALQDLLVPSPMGAAVRVGDVARVEERSMLSRIEREDQRYRRFVAYEFRGPTRLGDRVQEAVLEATFLPAGYAIETGNDWRWSTEEKRQIYGVLALAIILVLMVTAALFESIRQPFTVLLTVPMALIGVFLIFRYTGASFTREAYIGVIMMAGIVVNNAILLVDHVNHLRRVDGMALNAATIRGTLERVRPILMTSTTTIVGLLPLVLFTASANENIWNALAYALIGGLASSTILVLTVTPALYLLFEQRPEARRLARLEREAGLIPSP
jgi:hydrophobic/amphiphilic exporter-1 (mainly G- bacteria), HAE1 family